MKLWRWLSAVLAAPVATLTLSAGARAEGWVLQQYTPYGGEHILYVSSQGFKFLHKKMGVASVSKAPDWKLTIYNDKARTYFQTNYDQWRQRSARGQGLASLHQMRKYHHMPPHKVGSETVAGIATTKYCAGAPGQPGSLTYWLSNNMSVPEQMNLFLSSELGLPSLPGLPLRVDQVDDRGRRIRALDTLSAQLSNLPASTFTYPTGYKRVSEDIEVLVPEETKQTAAELLNDLTSDPTTQTQLNQYLNSRGAGAARAAPARQDYRQPAAAPSGYPRQAGSNPAKTQDIDKLIDSFLKSK